MLTTPEEANAEAHAGATATRRRSSPCKRLADLARGVGLCVRVIDIGRAAEAAAEDAREAALEAALCATQHASAAAHANTRA